MLHAVADQIGHREHFQIVLAAKFVELRDARHRAVFVHDLADDGGGVQAGDAREVDAGFGLACADEHATVAGAQWKDMARAGEILRAGLWIDGGEDGDGAVGGADAGGYAEAAVDGFGEGCAVDRGVDRGHERKVELVAAVFGEGQADQAAGVLSHEVDGFGGDFFGGHGEVAFVFAVFVVDEDDHAPLADFFNGFFDGGEFRCRFGHGCSAYLLRWR